MAKRYWEKTYSFTSHYDVPFQYVCGHCGKEVSGVRKVERTYQYSKTAPSTGGLAIREETTKYLP